MVTVSQVSSHFQTIRLGGSSRVRDESSGHRELGGRVFALDAALEGRGFQSQFLTWSCKLETDKTLVGSSGVFKGDFVLAFCHLFHLALYRAFDARDVLQVDLGTEPDEKVRCNEYLLIFIYFGLVGVGIHVNIHAVLVLWRGFHRVFSDIFASLVVPKRVGQHLPIVSLTQLGAKANAVLLVAI